MRKVRFLAVLLVLSMLLCACGSAGTPAGAISTEVDYLGDISTAPDSTESTETVDNTEDIIEFPSDESTEVNSEVDNTEDSSESTTPNTSESEVIVDSSESNTSESTTPNTSESDVVVDNTTSESTNTPETEPSNSSTSGGHVSWTGSTSLPTLGITIPTLNEYNSYALLNGRDITWAGDESTQEGWDAMQTVYDTANEIETTCKNLGIKCDSGFLVGNGAIEFAYGSYGSMNDLELWRDESNDTYTLEVNTRLSEGHIVLNGVDYAPYSRDILLYLCSIVSSSPDLLYSQIHEDITGDICISDSSWTTVGDCKVQYDDANSYNNHYVYLIKQN